MDDGLYGYNINLGGLGGKDEEAKADARALEASHHLLMTVPGSGIDGPGEIRQLREWEEALGGSQIIRRTYSRKEGNWTTFMSPQEQVAIWAGQGLYSMLHDAPSNEPSLNGADIEHNKRFVAREADLIYRCANAGIMYLTSAFSVGVPNETLIERGIYDPILTALHETREVGGGISAHLYGLPNMVAGERVGYDVLLDPQQARQAMIDERWDIGKHWLLRRPDWFMRRADTIGVSRPYVYGTEGANDLIPDANQILNQLRPQFGLPQYNFDIRGIQSLVLYFAAMFPEMDYQQAVAHVLEYAGRNIFHVDYIKTVNLFSLNDLWDRPQGHNFFNDMLRMVRKVLLPEINRRLKGQSTMFPGSDDSRWVAGEIYADNTWVRSQAGRGNNIVGRIYKSTPGYRLNETAKADINGEDYLWNVIRYQDEGVEVTGYIANKFHTFTPDTINEPPVVVDPPVDVVIDDAKIKEMMEAWLKANVPEIVEGWLNDHAVEVFLHIPFDQPDMPEHLARFASRFVRFVADELDPDRTTESPH